MDLHARYDLTRIVNAAGTFTPVGVSRSSARVRQATANALSDFFVIDELQDRASEALAAATGAEAGTVTHCGSAGITLAVAASMAGTAPARVAALPDTAGLANRVVIPAGHVVNYGHSILQDVRLAGAEPVVVGTDAVCTITDIESALAEARTACLLLVSSRLVRGAALDLAAAVSAAHRRGVPAIIDGAAQDLRLRALLDTGADLVVISGQKYLASPTAGLVVGRAGMTAAVRAQEKGIGRAMKPTKEAIIGALAALAERGDLDLAAWSRVQAEKVARFVARAGALRGVRAAAIADPTGLPFPRAEVAVDPVAAGMDAAALAQALRAGTPSIWTMGHGLARGCLLLELVPLNDAEIETILARLEAVLAPAEHAAR
jgi:L-seryl-tRNA(Ser) seleniumtransferase